MVNLFLEVKRMTKKGSKLIAFKIPNKYYEILEELCTDALEKSKYNKKINPVNYYTKATVLRFIIPFYDAEITKKKFKDLNYEKFVDSLMKDDKQPFLFIQMERSISEMVKYRNKMWKIIKEVNKVLNIFKRKYEKNNK